VIDDPFKLTEALIELPRGPHSLDRAVVESSQKARLLTAFVELAGEKGYNAVTIQDIVSRAGTAKRTFYDHFRDKDDCFKQAFEVGSASLVAAVVGAAEPEKDPIERIAVGVRGYLDYLARNAAFTRFFLVGGIGVGPNLIEVWVGWVEALADVLVLWRSESRKSHPEVPEITRLQALGALSAINEVARIAMLREDVDGIARIADELVELAIGMLTIEHGARRSA
jgi:AcrR family transcriptional regulator